MSINKHIKINKLEHNIEKKIYRTVYDDIKFGSINQRYLDVLKEKFKNIQEKVIYSIRNGYVNDIILRNYHKININKVMEEYENGSSILDLSNKYNMPPLTLLKMIFMKMGISKVEISKLFNYILKNELNTTNIDDKQLKLLHRNFDFLNQKDIEQLMMAIKNDVFTLVNNENQFDKAIKFEKRIEKKLAKSKIKYKTQNQLTKEQTEKYGHAISTPDFLLESKQLIINDVIINWIDAKNYYLPCTNFHKNKIKKQIDKYIKLYGSGLIIAKLGSCSDINFENALIVSYCDFKKALL